MPPAPVSGVCHSQVVLDSGSADRASALYQRVCSGTGTDHPRHLDRHCWQGTKPSGNVDRQRSSRAPRRGPGRLVAGHRRRDCYPWNLAGGERQPGMARPLDRRDGARTILRRLLGRRRRALAGQNVSGPAEFDPSGRSLRLVADRRPAGQLVAERLGESPA